MINRVPTKPSVRQYWWAWWLSVNSECYEDNAPNRLSAGASPQTPLGDLTALPDPLAGLGVGPPGKGKEGGGRREGRREGTGGEGKGGSPGMPKSRVGKPVCHSNYGSILISFRDMTNGRTMDGRLTGVASHRISGP